MRGLFKYLGDCGKIYSSLIDQWHNAESLATGHGYRHVTLELVKGAKHHRFSKEILNFFNHLLNL